MLFYDFSLHHFNSYYGKYIYLDGIKSRTQGSDPSIIIKLANPEKLN